MKLSEVKPESWKPAKTLEDGLRKAPCCDVQARLPESAGGKAEKQRVQTDAQILVGRNQPESSAVILTPSVNGENSYAAVGESQDLAISVICNSPSPKLAERGNSNPETPFGR